MVSESIVLQLLVIQTFKEVDSIVYGRHSMTTEGVEQFIAQNNHHPMIMAFQELLKASIEMVMDGEIPQFIENATPPLTLDAFLFLYQKVLICTLHQLYSKLREIIRSKGGINLLRKIYGK